MAKTVDQYVGSLESDKAEILERLRTIVKEAAPDATELVKWGQPVYEDENGPFCFIKSFRDHVNFGFWRGVDMEDPKSLLVGKGDKMRHVKVASVDEIDADAFALFVDQAVALNEMKGNPTRPNPIPT